MNVAKKRIPKMPMCFLVIALLMLGACYPTDCGGRWQGEDIVEDGWQLWRYTSWQSTRQVNITALVDESKIVDGVLTIPTKVGKYTITSFGGPYRGFVIGTKVEMIVVPAELTVNASFWEMAAGGHDEHMDPLPHNVKYVELLSSDFENMVDLGTWALAFYQNDDGSIEDLHNDNVIVIPDGSTQNFVNRVMALGRVPERFNFVEKSSFKEYHYEPSTAFELDGWKLWTEPSYEWDRQVNIIALLDDSKIVDEVLTIPTKVGEYTITSFGGVLNPFTVSTKVKMIVVPAEITVNGTFWLMFSVEYDSASGEMRRVPHNVKYIELSSSDYFKNLKDIHVASFASFTIVIPDGSMNIYLDEIAGRGILSSRYHFIEKSQFGGMDHE